MSDDKMKVAEKIYDVPLEDIEISDYNVRHLTEIVGDEQLKELADNIGRQGLLQPVILLGRPEDGPKFNLFVGQRRYLAHQLLKKKTIRARFGGKVDEWQAKSRSLAENFFRAELNHADAAEAVTELYKHFSRDVHRVAKETGMSTRRINQYVYIQELASPKTKRKLKYNQVKPRDVQRALRAAGGDKEKADQLLDMMSQYQLAKPQKDRMVEYGIAHPKASAEKIIEEAKPPRVEQSIMIKLQERVRRGLDLASKKLSMDPEDVAAQALTDWLSAKGFIIG